MTQIFTALRVFLLLAGCSKCQDVSSSAPKDASETSLSSKISSTTESDPTFSLTSLVPSSSSSSSEGTLQAATEAVLSGDRVMGTEEDGNMNIEEEISKLLSTEAVMMEDSKDYKDEDMDPSPVREKTLSKDDEDTSHLEGLDNLESSKVKEAALDDKLSIELRGIVKQIQVLGYFNYVYLKVYSLFKDMQKEVAAVLQEGGEEM